MAEEIARVEKNRSYVLKHNLSAIPRDPKTLESFNIENPTGVIEVPLGRVGPLQLKGPDVVGNLFVDSIHAPLATTEVTLVASCSRGCKAFNIAGGVNFEILSDGMSRAPVFIFDHPGDAVCFAQAINALEPEFSVWAESTSQYVQLDKMQSKVHLLCTYHCGSAAGQNMVTKATKHACDMLREKYETKFFIRDFFIEGHLASDKSASWGNVKTPRGVEVLVWGTITNQACQSVLGCSTDRLLLIQKIAKEGGIRNGQFGSNINTANILAAMFLATGQDVGSVAEASWSHLTSELDEETKDLRMTLYFPSLSVGTVGGGTAYPTQKEALRMIGCDKPGTKSRLAGVLAATALAGEASTSAAVLPVRLLVSLARISNQSIPFLQRSCSWS